MGMGSLCITGKGLFASAVNPALLALNSQARAGISYENRFGIKELGIKTAGASIPSGRTTLGAFLSGAGYSEFSRFSSAAGCGMKLGETLRAGIMINYHNERTSSEQLNNHYLTFEAGFLADLTEKTFFSVAVYNPVPNSLRENNLPSTIITGAGVVLSQAVFLGAEAELTTGMPLAVRTGFEYLIVNYLTLRGGFNSRNNSFSFGLGYNSGNTIIDMGFASHEKLGVTTSISLEFIIRNRKIR